ncbi:hypothetical protein LB507_004113, partial [Fusarium sp. FIESC RH6]
VQLDLVEDREMIKSEETMRGIRRKHVEKTRKWLVITSIKTHQSPLQISIPHQQSTASSNSIFNTLNSFPKTPNTNNSIKMQFSTLASVLTMAVAAIAAPADTLEARTGGGNNAVCSAQNKQVCCNGLLSCAVQVLGSNCNGNSYCCKSDAPVGALINVALLNCVDLL